MLSNAEKFANGLFAVILLAGGVSMNRFINAGPDYAVLLELRTWLIVLLAFFVLLNLNSRSALRAPDYARKMWISLAFIVAHALVLVSLLWSRNLEQGIVFVPDIIYLVVVVFLGHALSRRDPEGAMWIWLVTFWCAALIATVFSVASTGTVVGENAAIGAGGIGLSRLNASAVIAAMWLYWRDGRIIWLTVVPFFIVSILLSGSRAAMLGIVVAFAFWTLMSGTRSMHFVARRGNTLLKVLAVVLFLGVMILLTDYIVLVVIQFVGSLLLGSSGQSTGGVYLADRDIIFIDAVNLFRDNVVGGLGLGTYFGPVAELYPHNLLLSYAVDAGVIPLLLIVAISLVGLHAALRNRGTHVRAALTMAVFFATASMFAGSYYDARSLWVFLLLACIPQTKFAVVGVETITAEPINSG